jgi:hypothetical protein
MEFNGIVLMIALGGSITLMLVGVFIVAPVMWVGRLVLQAWRG